MLKLDNVKRKISIIVVLLFCVNTFLFAQVENIPISNPVYEFLLRAENKGLMKNQSLASLPLTKKEIITVLIELRKNINSLSELEKQTLYRFETEFDVFYYNPQTQKYEDKVVTQVDLTQGNKNGAEKPSLRSVLFHSDKDTVQVLSSHFFSDDEKYFYHYQDDNNKVSIRPLAKIDLNYRFGDNISDALMAHGGFRLNGTISGKLGFNLQATNGSLLSGDRLLAMQDPQLRQNVKFHDLNSDVDISESSVRYEDDWFYAYIGRETRLLGSGLEQRIFISSTSPAADAISFGAKFSKFEYRFSHYSLLGLKSDSLPVGTGFNFVIPPKYYVMHRFAFRPDWGELAFWEAVVYSDRSPEVAYLNPLSFLKSAEHSLRDRDNSVMGFDFTLRPVNSWQIKGSWLLDDIIISRVGTGYWSNKTAWNIATTYSFSSPIDIGVEYTRVEPYTYSHFNKQNSITNDGSMFGSFILPNSDRLLFNMNFWYGQRYPLFVNLSYTRHGSNVLDVNGSLLKNVGGDPLRAQNFWEGDSETVSFLDGDLSKLLRFDVGGGVELIRNFNLHLRLYYEHQVASTNFSDFGFRITFRVEDF